MPKSKPTPATALIALMGDYQLNPFSLSKAISLSNSAILQILKGKGKITVPTALRLAKFFGPNPEYWLDLQREADLADAAQNKELSSVLKGINKAVKPKAQPKASPKAPAKSAKANSAKPAKKASLQDKRKPAAKASGAKPAKKKVMKKTKSE